MIINKKQIAYNRTKRSQKPKYIVIHDTGNQNKGANANAHLSYFNSADRQASSDFFVDSTQILQVNDYNTYFSWHCGDGKGKYGITNGNSVAIEFCVNSDGDCDLAFQNAIALTKQLMAELGIDAEHVVRHYDASRKNCPASMSANNWARWNQFKVALTASTELTSINDLTWELAYRGIISDKDLWLKKMTEDEDVYWIARKTVKYLQSVNV